MSKIGSVDMPIEIIVDGFIKAMNDAADAIDRACGIIHKGPK